MAVWNIMERGAAGREVIKENMVGQRHSCGVTQDDMATIESFVYQHAEPNDFVRYPDGRMTRIVSMALA